nr:LPXTG cell wall anchor domain-containing protein [Streptococcus agalactiae]
MSFKTDYNTQSSVYFYSIHPTPEKPKPVEPQKATPKAPAKGLPQTGEASVAPLTALGAIILSAIGLAGFKKRKEN